MQNQIRGQILKNVHFAGNRLKFDNVMSENEQ